MTLSRREEILSKDILGVQDVMELNDMQYFNAAKLIRNIKRKTTCGLDIRGKVSTAVYLDYFEPKTNEVVKEERKYLRSDLRTIREYSNEYRQVNRQCSRCIACSDSKARGYCTRNKRNTGGAERWKGIIKLFIT